MQLFLVQGEGLTIFSQHRLTLKEEFLVLYKCRKLRLCWIHGRTMSNRLAMLLAQWIFGQLRDVAHPRSAERADLDRGGECIVRCAVLRKISYWPHPA